MKIAYVYGNQNHYDHGLSALLKRTLDVFAELEVTTETIDLGALHPPYYDGETTNALDAVMEKLKAADGIVFACTAQMFAPTALMQSFIEYLEHAEYSDVLKGKHCMIVALSREGGEKSALDYLTRVIQHIGGFVAASVGLQAWHLSGTDGYEFIDKTTEDFYRAVHQNRQYVIPLDFTVAEVPVQLTEVAKKEPPVDEETFAKPENLNVQLKNFTDTQEQEIEELSQLFAQKYTKGDIPLSDDNESPAIVMTKPPSPAKTVVHASAEPLNIPSNPFAPTAKEASSAKKSPAADTARALTQSLPQFFQSTLSAGLQATIQFNITGGAPFDGFLHIHSTECTYTEGNAPSPDIIIMADAATWLDVLKNKTTAQKAFMIGGIKVRGDFVLLTKFDTLFKFPS